MRTQKDTFIYDQLKAEGVSKPTAKFFIELMAYFKVSDPLVSTSKKLAELYDCTDRSIQRYIKELSESFNYIHVKPTYNNKNPKKTFIEKNTYFKTYLTKELEEKAEGFLNRDVNVNFKEGLFG